MDKARLYYIGTHSIELAIFLTFFGSLIPYGEWLVYSCLVWVAYILAFLFFCISIVAWWYQFFGTTVVTETVVTTEFSPPKANAYKRQPISGRSRTKY